jgi:hypothetical protein
MWATIEKFRTKERVLIDFKKVKAGVVEKKTSEQAILDPSVGQAHLDGSVCLV